MGHLFGTPIECGKFWSDHSLTASNGLGLKVQNLWKLRPCLHEYVFISFHGIETANFSLRFHLPSTRNRLKAITFENGLQREQYENDTKTMSRCNTIVAVSLKTISFSMKTYSCKRGQRLHFETTCCVIANQKEVFTILY